MMTTATGRDRLELKVPPPLVAAVSAFAMWLAHHGLPALSVAIPARPVVAAVLAAAGLLLGLAGVLAFRAVGTTIHPTHPEKTSAVVTTGVYAVSRNPMYLGLALLLSGWATWLANLLAFALVLAFAAYITRFQIVPEERIMREKFGDPYVAYLESVRRWL